MVIGRFTKLCIKFFSHTAKNSFSRIRVA